MIAKSLLEAVYSQIFPDSAAKGHMFKNYRRRNLWWRLA